MALLPKDCDMIVCPSMTTDILGHEFLKQVFGMASCGSARTGPH